MEEENEVLLKFEDPEELELFMKYMINSKDTEVDSDNKIIIINKKEDGVKLN